VWDLNFDPAVFVLVARLATWTPASPHVITNAYGGPTTPVFFATPAFFPTHIFSLTKGPGNFPYGIDVFPD